MATQQWRSRRLTSRNFKRRFSMSRFTKLPVRLVVVLPLAVLSIAGGRARLAAAADYKSVRIDGVPFVRQRTDFCGEACAEMALRKLGKRLDQDFVFNQSQLDPLEGRGC